MQLFSCILFVARGQIYGLTITGIGEGAKVIGSSKPPSGREGGRDVYVIDSNYRTVKYGVP